MSQIGQPTQHGLEIINEGGITHEQDRELEMRSENNGSVMERGKLKDNYTEKKRQQLSFQKLGIIVWYYVVVMSHTIDRYFFLSSASPWLHDCRTCQCSSHPHTKAHKCMHKLVCLVSRHAMQSLSPLTDRPVTDLFPKPVKDISKGSFIQITDIPFLLLASSGNPCRQFWLKINSNVAFQKQFSGYSK